MKIAMYSIALSTAFALSTNANAEIAEKEVIQCAALENSVERLSCYDVLADRKGLSKQTTITQSIGKGKWSTSTTTDPLTDQSIYVALLDADSGSGRYGGRVGMVVRCSKNTTEWYVNWNSFLGTETTTVTHRVGKSKAQRKSWVVSTDHKSSFYPGSPVPILKEMMKSDSLVANVTPYSESPLTASFNTSGAEAALADIRKGCGW
ncbi:type VI secretion system-associated protein TagO [Pseudomonas paraversuta]|uniref:type VI secretion system-associated protein TagO n=1 Tax=Pseudomonas paraversuta TaxID=2750624 RepID=UPI0019334D1F|nr:type VI secretion system-associated protein TagO [Pseudomonas paraversuta]